MTHRIGVAALTVVTLCITTNVAAQDKAKIERGMRVYEQQKCSLCHSIEGKGNKACALDGVGSKLTADEIRQWLVKPAEMTAKTKATRKADEGLRVATRRGYRGARRVFGEFEEEVGPTCGDGGSRSSRD